MPAINQVLEVTMSRHCSPTTPRRVAHAATLAVVCLAANTVSAVEPSLQDLSAALQSLPQIVIYQAKEVVTLDPARPTARAVAVVGDRILAVGELDDLKKAAGSQPYSVNTRFADQVVVPGFIAQHDHPLLAALTMTSEIIAIEDWVLPDGTRPAAKSRDDYLKKLAAANSRMKDPNALLLTLGYHQYFHGKLGKADLDAISTTRPIIVWHRSAH
jgi:predicted amidohydrolase YtcJ